MSENCSSYDGESASGHPKCGTGDKYIANCSEFPANFRSSLSEYITIGTSLSAESVKWWLKNNLYCHLPSTNTKYKFEPIANFLPGCYFNFTITGRGKYFLPEYQITNEEGETFYLKKFGNKWNLENSENIELAYLPDIDGVVSCPFGKGKIWRQLTPFL